MLATVALAAVLVGLGFWQLDRAAQKQTRASSFADRFSAPAVDLAAWSNSAIEEIQWRRVRTKGQFSGPHFLLDNRVNRGRVGFEVLSPFALVAGPTVLINRGWVPGGRDRKQVPTIATPVTAITLAGHAGPPPVTGLKFNEAADAFESFARGVVRVQSVDIEKIRSRYDLPLKPYVIYLDETSPAGFNRQWIPPGDGAAKHRAYAVQWFAMAIVLVIIYAVIGQRARANVD